MDISLVIDKAHYFAFKIDDIEEAHSYVKFIQFTTARAAYRLADRYDQKVLGYMFGYKQTSLYLPADTVNDQVNALKLLQLQVQTNCFRA